MAQRRMFSKTITNSSEFLMMSPTAQLLYYHLGMNADDDGFVEHFSIMRMTEAKPDDLRLLATRKFIRVFDDKVLIITQWKENNYIQKDRYTPSKYLEIYNEEIKKISEGEDHCIQDVYKMDTQVRLGKDRKGEDTNTPPKKQYGEFKSVLLSDDELNKLIERVGEDRAKELIFELDTYVQSKGVKYRNHYATLLNWAKRKFDDQKSKVKSSNVAFK